MRTAPTNPTMAADAGGSDEPSRKARPPANPTSGTVPPEMASGDGMRYPGGKNAAGTWQWIVDKLPTHAFYAEPFVGSGAILRRKAPALRSCIVDSDPAIIEWWRRLAWPGVEIVEGDGIAWLEQAAEWLDGDAVVYLDPPYVLGTRSKRRIYANELSDADHEQLLSAALTLACNVLISGYPSELYADRLAGWWCDERDVITRGGVMRTEVIWCNFDPAREYSLVRPTLGRDFRERERIGRKVRRWCNRIDRLPEAERRTLLLAMLDRQRKGPGGLAENGGPRGDGRQRLLRGITGTGSSAMTVETSPPSELARGSTK